MTEKLRSGLLLDVVGNPIAGYSVYRADDGSVHTLTTEERPGSLRQWGGSVWEHWWESQPGTPSK
jgi:hypothetical protein